MLLLPLLLIACGSPPSPTLDAGLTLLHQQAMTLVDASGTKVTLTGVNLGGWMLWEGPVWGASAFGERDLRVHLAPNIITDAEYDAFVARVHDEYTTEADIARIASLGFNVVRVPINHTVIEDDAAPGVFKEAGWATIDRVLSWCEKYKIYAVLDLHAAPGGQSRYFFSDPDPVTRLWQSPALQDRTVAIWRAMATRYASRDIVAGYDLLNEPDPPTGDALVALYSRIIAAIREVDTRHIVFLEGSDFARNFTMFTTKLDSNMAYSFHMYAFASDTRVSELETHAALAQAQQVPLWCGEFGVNTAEWVRSTTTLYDDPKYHLSGRSFWVWKQRRADHDEYALMRIKDELPNWQKIVAWSGSGWVSREPTSDEVTAGLNELITAAAFNRCEERSDMAKAILNID